MESAKRNYIYVEEHLCEYGEEYSEVKDQLRVLQKQKPDMFEQYTNEMMQRITYHGLHVLLIAKGKEFVPEHCNVCPFYQMEYEHGRMFYDCERNTHVFSPEFVLWGAKEERPEWCPYNDTEEKV